MRRPSIGAVAPVRAVPLLAAAALLGCIGPLRHVTVDRDPSVPLPAGASWAFRSHAEPEGPEAEGILDNPIVHQRLERLIAAELVAKGYRQVADPGEATLLVDYHLGVRERTGTVRTERRTGAYIPVTTCEDRGRTCTTRLVWGPYGPPEVVYRPYTYREGTLVVDVDDRASNQVAWRVVGQRRINQADESEETLRNVVVRLLRDLPAGDRAR